LISGNGDIADRVIQLAECVTYSKGHKLIAQGATDDCVYFIVAGSVEVRSGGRHIDIRGAPHTVGEMAAKKAGEVRTADVIVQSETLEALVLSGTEFRKIMKDSTAFSAQLDDLMDRLTRSKISQLGEKAPPKELSWTVLSLIVGVVAGAVGALGAWTLQLDALYIFWTGLALALAVFVFMLHLNPAFRYRNIAVMAGVSLILSVAYGSISFALTIDGQKIELPLIDFSVETEQKLAVFGIGSVVLLLLALIMGLLDLKLTNSHDN
jgi:CRP-like cAMP-binding protein